MKQSIGDLEVGNVIIEGKTKIIYEIPKSKDECLVFSKDKITAGDGVKRHDLEGKAAISNSTATSIFGLLSFAGIKNHFIRKHTDNSFIARKCSMVPIEWVVRRIATGSFLKRNIGVPEGYKFCPLKEETFFKDDANHDPQWSYEQLVSAKLKIKERVISDKDVRIMSLTTVAIFEILEKMWNSLNCQLIDMKVEYGIDESGEIILADLIDSDSWRLWPGGDKRLMKDKQFYRDMKEVTQEGLEQLKINFQWVANQLVHLTPKIDGRIAVLMGSEADLPFCRKIQELSNQYSIPCDLHVCSGHKVPMEVLKITAEYEGLLTPVVLIAVAGRSNALGPMLAGTSCFPVINCPPLGPDWVSQDIWSSLHVPSGLGCVSVLSPENAAQSAAQILAISDNFLWSRLRGLRLDKYVKLIRSNEKI